MKGDWANKQHFGERNGAAKLRATDIPNIRTDLEHGVPISAIAREYRVSRCAIQAIRDGRTWGLVE